MVNRNQKLKVSKNPEEIDGDLVVSVEKLQEIQHELEKINAEASDEVVEIEKNYNEIRKPVYDNRSEIIQSIPDFWFTAFLNHPVLGELLNKEEDRKIFKYLSSLEVEDCKDVKSGYSITFSFKPNPYFEDAKLEKSFNFLEEEGIMKVTATPIKWKEGNGVSHGKKGNKRVSFFTWFSQSDQRDDVDDEVTEFIKDDLWVNPLTYFNSKESGDEIETE